MADDTLLDVFVRVLPDPNTDLKAIIDAEVEKVQKLFTDLTTKIGQTTAAASRSAASASAPSGKSQGDALADGYKKALNSASDLSREMRQLDRLVKEVGNADISKRFVLAKDGLEDIKVSLASLKGDDDPLALETAVERIALIRRQIADIRQSSVGVSLSQSGEVRSSFDLETEKQESVQRERSRQSWKLFLDDQQRIIDENRKQLEQRNSDKSRLLEIERKIDEKANIDRVSALRKDIIERAVGAGGPSKGRTGLGDDYRDAKREAQELNREAGRLGRLIKETESESLETQFRLVKSEIENINAALIKADAKSDLPGLQDAVSRLVSVDERMRNLGTSATAAKIEVSRLRDQIDDLAESESRNIVQSKIKTNLQARQFQALSPDDKRAVVELTRDLMIQEDAYKRVARAALASGGATEDNARSMRVAANQVNETLEALDQIYSNAGNRDRSFNTLSNNAYQLGQAFEDAAVGFSLNGFAGAVRGAANNVAFLLNDLSRVPEFQKAVAEGFIAMRPNIPAKESAKMAASLVGMLPLIAGIGSALAVTVLPKIIEWLASLNDIEAKIEDISGELKTAFEDLDTEISFSINSRELSRSLGQMKSVEEILKQIRDLSLNAEDKKEELRLIGEGLQELDLIGDTQTPIDKINEQLQIVFDATEKAIGDFDKKFSFVGQENKRKPILDNILLAYGFESGTTSLLKLEQFKGQVVDVQRVVNQVQGDLLAGTTSLDTFKRGQRVLEEFKAGISDNLGRADLPESKEKTAALIAVVATYIGVLKKMEDAQREIEDSTAKVFEIGFDAARRKVSELQDELELLQSVQVGGNVKFDIDLLELNEKINEGRRLVTDSIQSIRDAAKDKGVTLDESGLKAIEQEFELRSSVDLQKLKNDKLKEQEKLEEKILDLKKKQNGESKFTDFESFAKQIQINALSSKEDSKSERLREIEEELEQVKEDLRRIAGAQGRLRGQRDFGDIPIGRRDIPEGFLESGRRIGADVPPLGGRITEQSIMEDLLRKFDEYTRQVVHAINGTSDAVKGQDKRARAN